MTDPAAAIRAYLLTDADLTALVSTRIWAERSTPIPGYTPAVGGAVCVTVRGGQPSYSDALLCPSIQVKAYGATEALANAVYRAVFAALHNAHAGTVRWGQCDVLGQTLSEPGTGSGTEWPFVLSFFTMWVTANP
jgi:hypothetical protein